MTISWDPDRYEALPLPHEEWGQRVVNKMELNGNETLVDAGCGSGRDAALALSRLPRGSIIGLDSSPTMRAACERRFIGSAQVKICAADLMETWPVETESVDAVMSVAAFHWLGRPERAWEQVARVLKPGGRVRIDAGGEGNIERLLAAVHAVSAGDLLPLWHYSGVDETIGHLRCVGLIPIEVNLRSSPAVFQTDVIYLDYLKNVVLHRLSDEQRRQVARTMGDRCVDYVRLEVFAAKPHSAASK